MKTVFCDPLLEWEEKKMMKKIFSSSWVINDLFIFYSSVAWKLDKACNLYEKEKQLLIFWCCEQK